MTYLEYNHDDAESGLIDEPISSPKISFVGSDRLIESEGDRAFRAWLKGDHKPLVRFAGRLLYRKQNYSHQRVLEEIKEVFPDSTYENVNLSDLASRMRNKHHIPIALKRGGPTGSRG